MFPSLPLTAPPAAAAPSSRSRVQALVEVALIFAVFALQGAWPAPDVNEPYYLGKAIHYWNPHAFPGDFFMQSADTHKVFYVAFGWLSLVLAQTSLAWTGRIVTWLLLAWAWRRLSVAVIPQRWYSVLTAALFGCLMERCHMAGEWVIGGVEAKGFAYVFVFLGLEALLRNRWNRALWLFGAASAFHVLVGGWAMVAAALAWLWIAARGPEGDRHIFRRSGVCEAHEQTGRKMSQSPGCPRLSSLWPGILGGLLLALPGLIPSLTLDGGVGGETLRQAHAIYVFERLSHHLVLSGMNRVFIARMILLCMIWLVLGLLAPRNAPLGRLHAFVAGAVLIACAGAAIHVLLFVDRELAAGLLRYYWFRLLDVAAPLGVALEAAALISSGFSGARDPAIASAAAPSVRRAGMSTRWLALALVVVAFHLGDLAKVRLTPQPPRGFKLTDFPAWQATCDWIVHAGVIPPHATFIAPRACQTLQWDTGRNEIASWKNVPQDAADLVAWWQRMQDLYATHEPPPNPRWYGALADLGTDRVRELGAKYHADYAIDRVPPPEEVLSAAGSSAQPPGAAGVPPVEPAPPLDLPELYRNRSFVVYRLP